MPPYRFLDHTADVGLVASGATLAEAFANAGEALSAILCDPDTVRELESRELIASASDTEALLVAWLSEVNYLFEVERFAFRRFEVRELADNTVESVGYGETLDLDRHEVGIQVKAVTYHELEIIEDAGGFSVRVILDV